MANLVASHDIGHHLGRMAPSRALGDGLFGVCLLHMRHRRIFLACLLANVVFSQDPKQTADQLTGDAKGSAYGFALGDINGDKFPDIALARSGAPNVLYLSGAR